MRNPYLTKSSKVLRCEACGSYDALVVDGRVLKLL